MWFKNRRAKFRKKQRSLQKEQLQKQKEANREGGDEEEAPTTITPENQLPPSSSSLEVEGPPRLLVSEISVELNVTSAEQSGSESATEDNATDKEEESNPQREELKSERVMTPGNVSPPCKRLGPKPGKGQALMTGTGTALIYCSWGGIRKQTVNQSIPLG